MIIPTGPLTDFTVPGSPAGSTSAVLSFGLQAGVIRRVATRLGEQGDRREFEAGLPISSGAVDGRDTKAHDPGPAEFL